MTGLYVSVPVACWRKGHAREYVETDLLPPPSTLYGFLLSLVGETNRGAHLGVRLTGGVVRPPPVSRVLRTMWRVKGSYDPESTAYVPLGNKVNATPDWQELVTGAEVVVFLSSEFERPGRKGTLEERVATALDHPERIERFGGLSLGESTHLVNEVRRLRPADFDRGFQLFVAHPEGTRSAPVWVRHATSQAQSVIGRIETRYGAPGVGELASVVRAPVM